MDDETRQAISALSKQAERAFIAAAKARAENVVIAGLLGHLTGRWAATTRDGNEVLAQIIEIISGAAHDATAADPDNEISRAVVNMATLLQHHMKVAFDGHVASQAERQGG